MRSTTPSGQTYQSRRLGLHQHHAVYRTAAFLNRATSASRSARIRTLWCGFGGRFLSQEDTPVSAPGLATGDQRRNNYSCSVTFQYASLMNFDQLAIRISCEA